MSMCDDKAMELAATTRAAIAIARETIHDLGHKLAEATKYGTPEEIVACVLEVVWNELKDMLASSASEHGQTVLAVACSYLDGPAHKDVVEALAKRAEGRHE